MHIVVFTGGDFTLPQDSLSFFDSFPKVDAVIAADSGADTLECYRQFYGNKVDFFPDCILGDMDSISNRKLLEKYADKVQVFPKDKDFTDTELALEKAFELKKICNDKSIITLVGGAGGAADHFLGIVDTFSSEKHSDFWLCGKQIFCFVKQDDVLYVSGLQLQDRVSIVRTTDTYEGGVIETEGFEWESSMFRKKGMPSISNRIASDHLKNNQPVRIGVKSGTFLVIAPVHVSLKKETLCL